MIEPIMQVQKDDMTNPNYSILVRAYAFGQYRIRLTSLLDKDPSAPPGHGGIVRELCTYSKVMMLEVVGALKMSYVPESVAEGYARPHNCEHPGGRIRLDNQEGDR